MLCTSAGAGTDPTFRKFLWFYLDRRSAGVYQIACRVQSLNHAHRVARRVWRGSPHSGPPAPSFAAIEATMPKPFQKSVRSDECVGNKRLTVLLLTFLYKRY
jgi:hypothetical protein